MRRCFLFALIVFTPFATAQEPLDTIVVSASRTPAALGQSGASVSVIERATIESHGGSFAADLLRQIPGLSVSNAGGYGKQTQVRLRGAEGNHVMVMIDGVEANDLGGNDEFEFGNLTTADIERIEVVRGPHSALWGSEALAGVINIITRGGEGPFAAELALEGGSFASNRIHAGAGGRGERHRVRVSVERVDTGGTNIARAGDEDDAYHALNLNANGALYVSDALTLSATARSSASENQVDSDFITGLPVDTPGLAETDQTYVGTHADLALFDKRWLQRIDLNWTSTANDNRDTAVFLESSTDTDRYEVTYQSTVHAMSERFLPARHRLTFALDHEHDRFVQRGPVTVFGDPNQRRTLDATGVVGEYHVSLPAAVALSASVRRDDNSDFRNATTWRGAASWALPGSGTAVSVAYGTGQKAPTFLERFGFSSGGLFGPTFIGNRALKPERSRGWEVNIGQGLWDERLRVQATWFSERLEDEIFGFAVDASGARATAVNQAGVSRRDGLEWAANAQLARHLTLTASYTYLDATELDRVTAAREDEVRRPRHQGAASLNWRDAAGRVQANIHLTHRGAQDDLAFLAPSFAQQRVRLAPFTVVGASLSYAFNPHLTAFARVDNAFDESYEEVLGFEQPGIAGFAGLRWRFVP